ncbi:CoA pyrophosphatase [Epibacterium ulvae]|uniref:CoA pyrophosphatase n=1 Tax=Epibacterium ulvae TaxID=1156985 RepID=UPI002491F760|nr:CoA pyrophosphatase [Epibacterium ulvae]
MRVTKLFTQLEHALGRSGNGSSDFDLNPDVVLPAGRRLRPAGVLMAIDLTQAAPQVVLTKRSSALKHHPGQIAFPGGKIDADDTGPVAASLREAWEEIGLPQSHARVLGTLPNHETVTGFTVTPVVAVIEQCFIPRPEPGEVDEIFKVPLSHVLNLENFTIEGRRWRGQRRHYYTVPYGPYYIWGATARMLHGLADRMAV